MDLGNIELEWIFEKVKELWNLRQITTLEIIRRILGKRVYRGLYRRNPRVCKGVVIREMMYGLEYSIYLYYANDLIVIRKYNDEFKRAERYRRAENPDFYERTEIYSPPEK